jgi:SAM-dependent methyltransferase
VNRFWIILCISFALEGLTLGKVFSSTLSQVLEAEAQSKGFNTHHTTRKSTPEETPKVTPQSVSAEPLQISSDYLSHSAPGHTLNLEALEEALRSKGNLSIPVEEAVRILKELATFDAGKFIIQHKGLNGYWTAQLILHAPEKKEPCLEQWLYLEAPVVKATRERFWIFHEILESLLVRDVSLASIPCGLMDDLLLLNTEPLEAVCLTGIDLDPDSLKLAEQNARMHQKAGVSFLERDAWDLGLCDAFHVITSNGLNIYEKSDERVVELYRQFHKALKPGGRLITSFLTPPPALSLESTWINYSTDDALKQKILFSEVIGVQWQTFRTETQTRAHLKAAGFKVVEVRYDSQGMFPTVVAEK